MKVKSLAYEICVASTAFLDKKLPDYFPDMDRKELLNFIDRNKTPQYKYMQADELYTRIYEEAMATIKHGNHLTVGQLIADLEQLGDDNSPVLIVDDDGHEYVPYEVPQYKSDNSAIIHITTKDRQY